MFERVLATCRACVAAYDRPDEPDEIFASRLEQIYSHRTKALA